MASQKSAADLDFLRNAISNISALIKTFRKVTQINFATTSPSSSSAGIHTSSLADSPHPLDLLSDASKLLEAQTTKLTLLVLNDPFTPKEIAHILNTLASSCLPALASGIELLPPEKYTANLHRYVSTSLSRIWAELHELIASIPHTEDAVRSLRTAADISSSTGKKSTLASTGVLWAECRKLMRLASQGASIVWKDEVKSNMALVEDAIGELEEWDPDESDDDEEDDEEGENTKRKPVIRTPTTSEDEEAVVTHAIHQMQINPFSAIKSRVLKHLKLIRMLCEALGKRRISTFPLVPARPSPSPVSTSENAPPQASLEQIKQLDEIIGHTQFFTSEADEIAGTLYSKDAENADKRLAALRERARQCVHLARQDWTGGEDLFTAWSDKWIARVMELGQ